MLQIIFIFFTVLLFFNSLKVYSFEIKSTFKEDQFLKFDNLVHLENSTISAHKDWVTCLLQLKNGLFVSGSADKLVKVWDENNNYKQLHSLNTNGFVQTLTELEEGLLLVGNYEGKVSVYNINDNFTFVMDFSAHNDSQITEMVQLPNGLVATSAVDGKINIYDPTLNFDLSHSFNASDKKIYALTYLNEGSLVTAGMDKNITVWDVNYNPSISFAAHNDTVTKLIVLDTGILTSSSDDGYIKFWDSKDSFKLLQTIFVSMAGVKTIAQLDNSTLASTLNGFSDNSIKLYELQNYTSTHNLTGHALDVLDVIKLSNGMMASASTDTTIKIWDYKNPGDQIFDTSAHPYVLIIAIVCLLSLGIYGAYALYRKKNLEDYMDNSAKEVLTK